MLVQSASHCYFIIASISALLLFGNVSKEKDLYFTAYSCTLTACITSCICDDDDDDPSVDELDIDRVTSISGPS